MINCYRYCFHARPDEFIDCEHPIDFRGNQTARDEVGCNDLAEKFYGISHDHLKIIHFSLVRRFEI